MSGAAWRPAAHARLVTLIISHLLHCFKVFLQVLDHFFINVTVLLQWQRNAAVRGDGRAVRRNVGVRQEQELHGLGVRVKRRHLARHVERPDRHGEPLTAQLGQHVQEAQRAVDVIHREHALVDAQGRRDHQRELQKEVGIPAGKRHHAAGHADQQHVRILLPAQRIDVSVEADHLLREGDRRVKQEVGQQLHTGVDAKGVRAQGRAPITQAIQITLELQLALKLSAVFAQPGHGDDRRADAAQLQPRAGSEI